MSKHEEHEESSEDDRPDAAEAMVPEIVWKVLQGVLTAVMLAVLSWAWKLEARLARNDQLIVDSEKLEQQVAGLEDRLDQERRRTDEHFTKIQIIENEIKHIRAGVDDIKILLSDRPKTVSVAPRPIVVTAPSPAPAQLSEPTDRRRRGSRGR